MSDHIENLKELFARAVELSEDARKKFLSLLDDEPVAELSSLLEARADSAKFLEPILSRSLENHGTEWAGKGKSLNSQESILNRKNPVLNSDMFWNDNGIFS